MCPRSTKVTCAFFCDTVAGFVEPGCMLQAETIALALLGGNSRFANVGILEERMDKLQAALPGIKLSTVMCKDLCILKADPAIVVHRLILFDRLLGSPDLRRLVSVAPQLLYAEVRIIACCWSR
jgi:hypothetical protein